jgi:hypothetical protein
MPKHRPEPEYVGIEKELHDAFLRLKAGDPENTDLRKKQRKDQLKINPTTVAKEAGHARTLIAHEKCRYPRILALIREEQKDSSAVPTSFEQINEKLQAENKILRAAVNLSMSRVAAMLRRMDSLETRANTKTKTAQRIIDAASTRTEQEEIVGKKLIDTTETVVPIRPK